MSPDSLSLDKRLDHRCDRFEAAWRAGQGPRIEDYLADAPDPEHSALLRALLPLEIELRLESGHKPTLDEYKRRFPHHIEIIKVVFAELPSLDGTRLLPDNSQDNELGPDIYLGDFRIEKRIGAGGMGIVYQARQISLNRPVALKVLGSALTHPSDIARFRRSAQAAAKLQHSGIATIHFIGQDNEVCYLAMELIDGISLHNILSALKLSRYEDAGIDVLAGHMNAGQSAASLRFDRPGDTIDDGQTTDEHQPRGMAITTEANRILRSSQHLRRCCELARDAAQALHYAHEQGVVHRDIKPGNIMVDRQGGVHLIDFGLARFHEDASFTNTGQLVGTPMYMSPEQVTGRVHVDHRTDVYSLGLVLYELLTLTAPVQARTREELLRRIVTKPLPPIGCLNEAIPKSVESIVHKATAHDPDARYESAVAFANDLQNHLDGKPVCARPYAYSFDDHEIVLNRPRQIEHAATACTAMAIVIIGSALAMTGFALKQGGADVDYVYQGIAISIEVLLCLILYAAGRGLMRAKPWARIVSMLLSLALTISGVSFAVIGTTSLSGRIDSPEQFLIAYSQVFPGFFYALCTTTIVYWLRHPRTREWFSLARQLRREHECVKGQREKIVNGPR
jgi:serine/threonine protein kinase